MKLFKIPSGVACALLVAAAAMAQETQQHNQSKTGNPSAGAAPVLAIESFTHDFGEVKPGDPLRFAFKIKNQGKADLVINSVTPG